MGTDPDRPADRADSGTLREQIATWLADRFQSVPGAYQGKPKKLAAHAESLYAEVVAPIEAQRDQAAKNAMTCFEQAHDHLRAERDQLRADLTEARRDLAYERDVHVSPDPDPKETR